jgi:hypothetical protein
MITFEKSKRGTKVFEDKKHIKTIPERYEKYFEQVEIDKTKKRLTGKERFSFEYLYFIALLEKNEKYVWELIKDAKPVATREVIVHDGSKRYELLYDNGKRIKIPTELYLYFDEKESTKYSNY